MLHIWKYTGAGNDFVILQKPQNMAFAALARCLCDRRFGVGADGALFVAEAEEGAAARMLYYNADGSRAAFCGNGLRCFAHFLHFTGQVPDDTFAVQTDCGPRQVWIEGPDRVRVTMGHAQQQTLPMALPGVGRAALVWMNVPHLVLFDGTGVGQLLELGPRLEKDSAFSGGVNVDLVCPGQDGIRVYTWERGAGHTLACGTGCCAAAFAAGLAPGQTMQVQAEGGRMQVSRDAAGQLYLAGPAVCCFFGSVPEGYFEAQCDIIGLVKACGAGKEGCG